MNSRSTSGLLLLLSAALIGLTGSSCKSLENDPGHNLYERVLEDNFDEAPAAVVGTTADTRLVIFREHSFVAEPRPEGEAFGKGGHHRQAASTAGDSSQGLRLFREASFRLAEARANSIEGMLALRAAGMSDEVIADLFPTSDDWTMMYMNTLDLSRDAIQAELDSGVRIEELRSEGARQATPTFFGGQLSEIGYVDLDYEWDTEGGYEEYDDDGCEASGDCDQDGEYEGEHCKASGDWDDDEAECGDCDDDEGDQCEASGDCDDDEGECGDDCEEPCCAEAAATCESDSTCEVSVTCEVVTLTDVTECSLEDVSSCEADCQKPCCAAPKCDAPAAKSDCEKPCCAEAAPTCELTATATLLPAPDSGAFEGKSVQVFSSGARSEGNVGFGLTTTEGGYASMALVADDSDSLLSQVYFQGAPEGSFEGTPTTPKAGKTWKVKYSCTELAGETVDLTVTCLDAPKGKNEAPRLTATFQAELNKKGKATLKADLPKDWRLVSIEGPGAKPLFAVFL